jgi:hypothetical protein
MIQIIAFHHKLALLLGVVLACTTSLSSEASSLIENDKQRNELIGPVRKVITKTQYDTTADSYDPSGNLIESVIDSKFANSESRSKFIFTYDDQELVKEELCYGDDGALVYRTLFNFSFHEDGKPAAKVAAADDGSYLRSEFWIYDDRGNLAEKIYFTGAGFIDGFIDKSIFDVQGKVIYAIRYRGKAIMFESVKHYNLKGELVESLYYKADGSLSRKDQYKYDEASRQMEESSDFYKHYFGLRRTLTRYEFDAYGNWVRQTVEQWAHGTDITKPVPAEVIQERIISYY